MKNKFMTHHKDRECDYCNKKAYIIADFLPFEGDWIRIAGCEKHMRLAMWEQESVRRREEFRQRMRQFNKQTFVNLVGHP